MKRLSCGQCLRWGTPSCDYHQLGSTSQMTCSYGYEEGEGEEAKQYIFKGLAIIALWFFISVGSALCFSDSIDAAIRVFCIVFFVPIGIVLLCAGFASVL